MTNAALTEIIETYGNRLFCINLDNTRFIYIGYNGGVALENLSLVTMGGIDFIRLAQVDNSSGVEVHYTTNHVTDSIQWIGIMDEGYESYGVDPLKMR